MNTFGIIIFITSVVTLTHCKPRDNSAFAAPKVNTVCYEHIGCFSKNGTFRGILNMLPESPEKIGTSFTLFTKKNLNAGQELDYKDLDTLTTALFNSSAYTVFLVHGYDINFDPKEWFLKPAFLNHIECQVIVVDWRKGSIPPVYWTATANSELVGRQVAVLIKKLVDTRGLKTGNVHIVGGSLGAHLAGFAGKWLINEYGPEYKLGRISGNDPAGMYFHDASDSVHLSSKDAHFVDIIHTSAGRDMGTGQIGIKKATGHVDFYPNGGDPQPGCDFRKNLTCSHTRADDLYADSLTSNVCTFNSCPCLPGSDTCEKVQCRGCDDENRSQLGFPAIQKSVRGMQYLETNAERPFCKLQANNCI